MGKLLRFFGGCTAICGALAPAVFYNPESVVYGIFAVLVGLLVFGFGRMV